MEQSDLNDNSKKIKEELRSHIAQSLLRYLLICAILTIAILFNGYQISTNYILIALIPIAYFIIRLIFPPVNQYNPLALQSLNFSFKWLNIICALIIVFIITAGSALISYNIGYSNGNKQDSEILGKLVNNGAEVAITKEAKDAQDKKLKEMQDELDFFEYSVVIVLDNGTKYYHKYNGCNVIKTDKSDYFVFNSENAEYLGYKPCPNCYK